MFNSFQPSASRRVRVGRAAFTLAEIMVALATFVLVTAGLIYGYTQSNRLAEWSAMSLAAQSYAEQAVEQARAAKWSVSATTNGPGTGDELAATNISSHAAFTNYSQTNIMVVPITGTAFNVTNSVSVSALTNLAYPVRQIRADCVWQFPLSGQWFTNTVITERAPDQ